MSRSFFSTLLLSFAVTASIATSGTDAGDVLDDVDDVLDGGTDPNPPTDPAPPTQPTEPVDVDDCDYEPMAPYAEVVCLAPGDALTIDFALRVDTDELGLLLANPSWINGAALLDADDAEVELHLKSPAGAMTEVLVTEPDWPIDENTVFVDDPLTGCVDLAGACIASGWSFTLENVGDTDAVVHFQLQPGVAGNAATIDVVELD